MLCRANEQVLRERRLERAQHGTRHPGHLDAVLAAEGPRSGPGQATLTRVPLFAWDTSGAQAPDYDALLGWLRSGTSEVG